MWSSWSLVLLFCAVIAAADPYQQFTEAFGQEPFLVIINFRSNKIISWTSPRSTLECTVDSEVQAEIEVYSEGIGHAAIFFRREKGGPIIGTGQTGEDHNQGLSLLLHGLGFTTITNTIFTDGSLNNFSFLDHKSQLAMAHRVHGNITGSRFGFFSFRLSQQQANNIQEFMDEYKNASAEQNYGFVVDPLKLEGGGCTSFANAIVERSGVSFPLQQHWNRTVYIPQQLMGFNQSLIDHTVDVRYKGPVLQNRTVNILEPLAFNHWARDASDGYPFMLYDPELFYLASALSRNHLMTKRGLEPLAIVDMVHNDSSVDKLKREVRAFIDSAGDAATIVNLYGMPGVFMS